MSSIQLYYNFKAFGEDSWQTYLLITTAITAGTTFFTSVISFFTMRKRILKYQSRIQKIAIELFLHNEKLGVYHYKTRDLQLYKKVSVISNLDYRGIVYAEKKNKQKRSTISSKAS
ncbi:hypothetical protein AB5V95_00675 [Metamycoplasma spumans]|uniref:hypothetical protein n=1 Tax=Metamycoplasma spumans TaxID=92406 RepID=UPI0034DD06D5